MNLPNRVLNGMDICSVVMTFADVLTWVAIPFVLSTVYFGIRKGENNYYETDKYDGNGTGFTRTLVIFSARVTCVSRKLIPTLHEVVEKRISTR